METFTLVNLAAYSVQVLCIVTLASVMSWLLHIDAASVRYGYWRLILAVCLLLPLLQGRQMPVAAGGAPATGVDTQMGVAAVEGAATAASFDWTSMILPLLAAGAGARLLWIAVSLMRLRRLRRMGHCAPETELHTELQNIIGTRCEIRYVTRLHQPVTFGLWRPVILLPAGLAGRSEDIQRAVLSHELFHVKRRDWGWLLVEEAVCALLWFNPAVWWTVSSVQLAREVVVDELAVLATGRRRAYVEALMTFADETSLAPVAAFGGRRQLFNRIVALSKEVGMSSHRLVFTCGIMAAALAAGSWQAVTAFPLTGSEPQAVLQNSPGPLEQRANPITPENPVPRRVNYETPVYPAEARAAGARGNVTLMITLDELGRVAEARRVHLSMRSSNPPVTLTFSSSNIEDDKNFLINRSREQSDALRAIAAAFTDAAVRALQQWRYDPPAAGPISFPVTMTFSENQEGAGIEGAVASTAGSSGNFQVDGALRVGGNVRTPVKIRDVRPIYPPLAQAGQVSGMVIAEVRIGTDGLVEDARILKSIPLLDQAALDAITQWRFRPTLMNGRPVPVIMTVTVNFTLDKSQFVPREGIEVVPEPQGRATLSTQPVSPNRMPEVIKEVKPTYPADARAANLQGTVEVKATIGTDGKVTDVRVVRSIPMLDEAAIAAVRQWEFTPVPEPVAVDIELTFTTRRPAR